MVIVPYQGSKTWRVFTIVELCIYASDLKEVGGVVNEPGHSKRYNLLPCSLIRVFTRAL